MSAAGRSQALSRRAPARAALLPLLLGAGACSYTFDETAADWPLVGAAIDPSAFQRTVVAGDQYTVTYWVVAGADGANWLAFHDDPDRKTARLRLVRLGEPSREEVVSAPRPPAGDDEEWPPQPVRVAPGAIYAFQANGNVLVHRPGAGADGTLSLAPDAAAAQEAFRAISNDGGAMAWRDGDTALVIARTDGSYRRVIPTPDLPKLSDIRVDVFFSDDGEVAMVASDHWSVHDTRSELSAVDSRLTDNLPGRPRLPYSVHYLAASRTMLTCDMGVGFHDNLRAVPLDGSPPRVLGSGCISFPYWLDSQPPDVANSDGDWDYASRVLHIPPGLLDELWLARYPLPIDAPGDRILYFGYGPELRSVSIEGHSATSSLLDLPAVSNWTYVPAPLAIQPPHWAAIDVGQPVYFGAFAALVDGAPAMVRGRMLRLSRDGTRVRFLEHTANEPQSGDLMSGPIGGPYQRIARNGHAYEELPDGRLLAIVNFPFPGYHNRLVLIDEERREVRRFVDAAVSFHLLPGAREALVVLARPGPYAPTPILRVPIPAR